MLGSPSGRCGSHELRRRDGVDVSASGFGAAHRVLRAIGVVALAALLAACTSTASGKKQSAPPVAQTAPPGSSAGMEAYYSQKPSWSRCQEGFECATVKVPLDYRKPQGTQLKLAVIRLPAKSRSKRIGSLVTNPGGPGGSGVSFIRQAAGLFGSDVRARFDLVGFDPRGVGESDPVDCLDGRRLDAYFSTDTSPDDRREVTKVLQEGKEFADGCKAGSGAELPYVGTVNAAHDIDVLRAALGDQKLTYAGFSYGTYLGAFYAEQFPKNVRALVLDGAVDPAISSTDTLLEQSKGFETALRAFAADCITQPDCPLGKSVDAALGKISTLQREADRTPLSNGTGDGRQVNEPWVTMGIATALYSKSAWTQLRLGLGRALNQRDGTVLLRLADQMIERRPDGSYSNQMEANMAVNCVDKPNPPSAAAYEKEVDKAKRAAPRFGTFVMWGGLPCVYWPVKPKEKPRPLAAAGAKPILVIGTIRDPATPYRWAQALASQLKSGVLLTHDGDGHTAYLGGPACVVSATNRYLISGTPPRDGTVCR